MRERGRNKELLGWLGMRDGVLRLDKNLVYGVWDLPERRETGTRSQGGDGEEIVNE